MIVIVMILIIGVIYFAGISNDKNHEEYQIQAQDFETKDTTKLSARPRQTKIHVDTEPDAVIASLSAKEQGKGRMQERKIHVDAEFNAAVAKLSLQEQGAGSPHQAVRDSIAKHYGALWNTILTCLTVFLSQNKLTEPPWLFDTQLFMNLLLDIASLGSNPQTAFAHGNLPSHYLAKEILSRHFEKCLGARGYPNFIDDFVDGRYWGLEVEIYAVTRAEFLKEPDRLYDMRFSDVKEELELYREECRKLGEDGRVYGEACYTYALRSAFHCVLTCHEAIELSSKIEKLRNDNELITIIVNMRHEYEDIDTLSQQFAPIYNEFYKKDYGLDHLEVISLYRMWGEESSKESMAAIIKYGLAPLIDELYEKNNGTFMTPRHLNEVLVSAAQRIDWALGSFSKRDMASCYMTICSRLSGLLTLESLLWSYADGLVPFIDACNKQKVAYDRERFLNGKF